MNTKERILQVSLQLFARDGYEAVSVSDIAGELNFTKSALYKHYKNKRDIFDSIVQRMTEYDYEKNSKVETPAGLFDNFPEKLKNSPIEAVSAYALVQFVFWTSDSFASDFRKMLCIERRRNAEMETMYQRFLGTGPMKYIADVLRKNEKPALSEAESESLAVEFYSPVYTLIDIYDGFEDKNKIAALLKKHIESFVERLQNMAEPEG